MPIIPLFLVGLASVLEQPAARCAAADPTGLVPAAWIRFTDAAERLDGTPYLWLGRTELQVAFAVRPQSGDAFELLWGAKDDLREATLIVNGVRTRARSGGYHGFRWLRLPVPEGLQGERYDLVLRATPDGQAKPAFFAELRLVTAASTPTPPDLKAPAYRAQVTQRNVAVAPVAQTEAFPEMRKLWDREPAPPAAPAADPRVEERFRQAERNARLATEAFYRCRRFVDGWLAHADPITGLIPRNLRESRDFWNGRDSAADNYPFMVLTAALTDRPLFEGRMLEMLRTETRLTCRLDRLPDDYSFSKQGWRREALDLEAMILDGAEYVKDGLIPLTEWLGPSPWSERMTGIIEDIWKHARIETPFGLIPTRNVEVCGDLIQACARLYWFTGEDKYLDWAIRLGDFFLLGENHPTRHSERLRLSDHGCEIVNGLTELYVAVSRVRPAKKQAYQQPLRELFDCILERGRNPDGMLYSWFNPQTGEHSSDVCDTWGYDYDGVYTMYLLDGLEAYRDAVRHALGNLKGKYVGAAWGDKSADGFADSIEGAINLLNREPVDSAVDWVDSQIRMMWAIQKPDGIIEGWHGDGNSARTSIMYALWKTAGATVQPWRADLRLGAVHEADALYLSLAAEEPWAGRVIFDRPRHRLYLRLPLDYPRINQFPEWFTTTPEGRHVVRDLSRGKATVRSGVELLEGLAVSLEPGRELRLIVEPTQSAPD